MYVLKFMVYVLKFMVEYLVKFYLFKITVRFSQNHTPTLPPNRVLSQSSAYYMPTTAETLTFFKSSSFGPARQDVSRKKTK